MSIVSRRVKLKIGYLVKGMVNINAVTYKKDYKIEH